MINNATNYYNELRLLGFGLVFILIVLLIVVLAISKLYSWVYHLEIQLKSQTSPEHRALAYEYYRRIMEERQPQDRKDYLNKMFKDE